MEPESLFKKLSDDLKTSEKPEEREGFLKPWEIESIIMSLATSRDDDDDVFSEEEAIAVIKWCEEQRIGSALVDLVCRGLANINWKNGEPTFQITDDGKTLYTGESNGRVN